MKPTLSFDKAFSELEKLVEQIEDENIQLDSLAYKVKQANELIKYCETRLRNISDDIENEKTNN
ncbi:MAG: Exodeoxyribonuclease small subunit [Ferruginibacter sp.]|nr:Exodeoxyribonuclease small subunit [Ferruginibacter sp.]